MAEPVKFNKALLWDYDLTPEDLQKEEVFLLYLSRVLNNGSFQDLKEIPLETIRTYLSRLHLRSSVRKFWQWYLA